MMKKLVNFASSLLAIVAGLLFGLLILFITNSQDAMAGFQTILAGGLSNGISGVGQVLYLATPIIMTGLSVGFAFKTGLFNIGASGQFTLGAFVAVYIGIKGSFLGPVHWIVALIAAGIAGAIWGFIPGILKAIFNVNEVISSIMMNYIGMYFVNMLVFRNIYDSGRNQSLPVASTALIPKAGLNTLFRARNLNIGIFIALFFVILMYILLEKTTFGYELKACGQNKDAAKYAGINSKRNIALSMTIAGALAGIGGALLYLAGSGKYLQVVDIIAPEGFSGISVALLGLSNPIGILFSGIFIAHIIVGGNYLQLYNYVPEVIDMIISVIIYCGAFSLLFRAVLKKMITRREEKK
ncbi:ABC transporter permease [Fusobacterium sp. MFO224]|uniref:ABC transporter permease n=1 Tax=Fusobacterium sp. MFO224 TaxID=3378070 RepID=UPI003851C857